MADTFDCTKCICMIGLMVFVFAILCLLVCFYLGGFWLFSHLGLFLPLPSEAFRTSVI